MRPQRWRRAVPRPPRHRALPLARRGRGHRAHVELETTATPPGCQRTETGAAAAEYVVVILWSRVLLTNLCGAVYGISGCPGAPTAPSCRT